MSAGPGAGGVLELLRSVPLFAGLDAGALEPLAAACRRRRYRVRETLFHEGDPGHTLYIVLSGHVSIQRVNELGQIVPIATRGPGEWIGELSLLDGKPRSADVETVDACELLALDRDAFLGCMDRTPGMARSIIRCLAARLREAADAADATRSLDVAGRIGACLLDLAEAHGRPGPRGGTLIDHRLTQADLADRVGTTRETVNRVLARLRAIGTLEVASGRIVVRDAARLRRIAGR